MLKCKNLLDLIFQWVYFPVNTLNYAKIKINTHSTVFRRTVIFLPGVATDVHCTYVQAIVFLDFLAQPRPNCTTISRRNKKWALTKLLHVHNLQCGGILSNLVLLDHNYPTYSLLLSRFSLLPSLYLSFSLPSLYLSVYLSIYLCIITFPLLLLIQLLLSLLFILSTTSILLGSSHFLPKIFFRILLSFIFRSLISFQIF